MENLTVTVKFPASRQKQVLSKYRKTGAGNTTTKSKSTFDCPSGNNSSSRWWRFSFQLHQYLQVKDPFMTSIAYWTGCFFCFLHQHCSDEPIVDAQPISAQPQSGSPRVWRRRRTNCAAFARVGCRTWRTWAERSLSVKPNTEAEQLHSPEDGAQAFLFPPQLQPSCKDGAVNQVARRKIANREKQNKKRTLPLRPA